MSENDLLAPKLILTEPQRNTERNSIFVELEQKKKDDKNKSINQKKEIGWGNQIRSYVLQPYKLVKDLRTEYQSPNPNKVLDGDIDEFLSKALVMDKN